MTSHLNSRRLGALVCVLALAGCAGTRPMPYSGIASSPQLRANPDEDSDHAPYTFSSGADWRQYSSVILEPVGIYAGPDHQFEEVDARDREILARYMQAHFSEALKSRFAITNQPSLATLRVKATLTGAKPSTRYLSTFLRFDLAGGPYNMVQAVRGGEGAMTGSVSYAVEIHDAASNRLLLAYVAKQYPNAWNLKATLGKLDASKTGIDNAAEDLVARLN